MSQNYQLLLSLFYMILYFYFNDTGIKNQKENSSMESSVQRLHPIMLKFKSGNDLSN